MKIKFFFGKTKSPGIMSFTHDDYIIVENGKKKIVTYREPKKIDHTIKTMYGVSLGKTFFGIINTKSKS